MTSDSSPVFSVERKCDHTYVGGCMLNHMNAIAWRLVFYVSSDNQNYGIGTEMILIYLHICKKHD